jgi:serine-type D-Ala-D-Ala carboxypeptidase/endopeptidase
VAFVLSAWPPRNDAESGPAKRATVRELAQGSNFPRMRQRPGRSGPQACRQAANYGMGLWVAVDCDLGFTLSHSGGYPGYGSHMLLLPDYGVGLFAFANRTYAGPSAPVWDAAIALQKAGYFKERNSPISDELAASYRAVGAVYKQGDAAPASGVFAMNFFLDRDAAGWRRDLADLKKNVGECNTSAPLTATSALSGDFIWDCAHGRVAGKVLLAPTHPASIQSLELMRKAP